MGGAWRDDHPDNIQATHWWCNEEKGSTRMECGAAGQSSPLLHLTAANETRHNPKTNYVKRSGAPRPNAEESAIEQRSSGVIPFDQTCAMRHHCFQFSELRQEGPYIMDGRSDSAWTGLKNRIESRGKRLKLIEGSKFGRSTLSKAVAEAIQGTLLGETEHDLKTHHLRLFHLLLPVRPRII
jgi:hypothetical protein